MKPQMKMLETCINAEYEMSDASELADFLSNPTKNVLDIAFLVALTDGASEILCDANNIDEEIAKCHISGNYEALGRAVMAQVSKYVGDLVENMDMDDIKAEDMNADYEAVDRVSRLTDWTKLHR